MKVFKNKKNVLLLGRLKEKKKTLKKKNKYLTCSIAQLYKLRSRVVKYLP